MPHHDHSCREWNEAAIFMLNNVQVLMQEDRWLCSFCQQQNAVDIGVQDLRV